MLTEKHKSKCCDAPAQQIYVLPNFGKAYLKKHKQPLQSWQDIFICSDCEKKCEVVSELVEL